MILASAIVGSGELIATTTLGAQVGYSALWVIILGCLIKPVVQAEIGRYTIATGETGLAAFDRIPGPRWKVSWIVWAWAMMVLMTQLQVGAMFGGVSQVMNQLVPEVPVNSWVLIFLGITLALLLGGGYERIEGLAMVKVGLFTLLTLLSALLLTQNPQYFAWSDLWSGVQFRLPAPVCLRRWLFLAALGSEHRKWWSTLTGVSKKGMPDLLVEGKKRMNGGSELRAGYAS